MSVSKKCADFLREFHEAEVGQKLKATHAHEIVAAFFGYKSHAAHLAELAYPLSAIEDAAIMMPDVAQVERRLRRLTNLPHGVPSAIKLADILSNYLSQNNMFKGKIWLYESLGNYVVEQFLLEEDAYISGELSGDMADTNAYFETFPDYEEPTVHELDDEVQVVVDGLLSGDQDPDRPYSGHQIGFGVTVTLYRIAGRTCFMEPEIEVGAATSSGYFDMDDTPNAASVG